MSHTPDTATDPFLDEEWLATRGPRSRWRVALLAALAMAVVFLAGAQVQKHFGASSGTASVGAAFPGGGQGIPSGFPQLGGGTTAPSSASSAAGKQAASLIGTVIGAHGNTLRIKDLGGRTHTVRIGADTSITRLATLHARDLEPGATVVVEQGTGSSKNHPAASITVR